MMKIRKNFLPLNRPSIGAAEIAGVTECLKSRWITTGPHCAAFEERFSKWGSAADAFKFWSDRAVKYIDALHGIKR